MKELRLLLKELGGVVVRFPLYITHYVLGMLAVALSDFEITGIAFFSVALGFATNPFCGAASFFGLYTLARLANSLAGAIRMGQTDISRSIDRHTQVFKQGDSHAH